MNSNRPASSNTKQFQSATPNGASRSTKPETNAPSMPPSVNLVDLMYDGFYMVFLLKNNHLPQDATHFREQVREFLMGLDKHVVRQSHAITISPEDLHLTKFAFCALVDEIVLTGPSKLRDDWERRPLQLQFFGEQLAGETFFTHLETLREKGASRIQALEVFHLCLLLGFQGKYMLEGTEKLGYITTKLGDDIAYLRGKRIDFAPNWAAPDQVMHALKTRAPLWVIGSLLGVVGLLGLVGIRSLLNHQIDKQLAGYQHIVKLPARTAYVNITLP